MVLSNGSTIIKTGVFIFVILISISAQSWAANPSTPSIDCVQAQQVSFSPEVIFHDEFEDNAPFSQKYSDYDTHNGDLAIVTTTAFGGSTRSARGRWQQGQVEAGYFTYMFGRNPIASKSHSTTDFKELYWRIYLKTSKAWTGNPAKLSRATVFASNNWAQAMIAHLWGENDYFLEIDPATGIDSNNNLITTTYNDFTHLRWLGLRKGTTPIYNTSSSNTWYCVEVHVKLNSPGNSDGIFEFWIDGNLEARRTDLNWVGTWQGYGINAVLFENYWNSGSTRLQERYMDNIVISTQRIGFVLSPVNPFIYVTQFEDPDSGDIQSSIEAQVSTTTDITGLVWSGSVNGIEKSIQVHNSNGSFQGALISRNSLENNTLYYTRSRQKDNTGNFSSWSNWKIFKTETAGSDTTPPAVPQGVNIQIIQ